MAHICPAAVAAEPFKDASVSCLVQTKSRLCVKSAQPLCQGMHSHCQPTSTHLRHTITLTFTLTEFVVVEIQVHSLSVRAKGKLLLENTQLTVTAGRRYGLVGPNGKGKSTLLRLIARRQIPVPEALDVLLVEQVLSLYLAVGISITLLLCIWCWMEMTSSSSALESCLSMLMGMQVTNWEYKSQIGNISHMGPVMSKCKIVKNGLQGRAQ